MVAASRVASLGRSTPTPRPILTVPSVAGVGVVAYLLTTGRWGAYVGVPPLFLTDLLLGLAVGRQLVIRVGLGPRPAPLPEGRGLGLALLLVTWTGFRLVAGFPRLDFVALRDAAPYLYVACVFLSAYGIRYASHDARSRAAAVLQGALLLHAAWVALAVAVPGLTSALPSIGGGAVRLLQVRSDFDGLVLGVTAATAFVRWATKGRRRDLVVLVGSLGLVMMLTSRAALIGTACCLALAIVAVKQSARRLDALWRLSLVPLGVLILVAFLPNTTAGARLLETFGASAGPAGVVHASAAGTTAARQAAWAQVVDYVDDENDRLLVGVGFGPDFMAESGADVQLLGTQVAAEGEVRSPHNYLVGTYARLGLVGLMLVLLLTGRTLRAIWDGRTRLADDGLLLVASLGVVGFLPVAALGVVLESPFGAVPYYWLVGIVLMQARSTVATQPADERPRHTTTTGHSPAQQGF